MPNHVENILKIKGNIYFLERLINEADDGKEKFSIRKLVPIPEEVAKIASPTTIISNKEYLKELKEKNERIKKNPDFDTGLPLTERKSKELIKKFGVNNWYDWALLNWGTKWGSYDSDIIKKGKSYIKYIFNSAWSPPIQAIDKISHMFPDLIFTLKYVEEGNGFKGIATFQNGLIEDIEL